MTTINYKPRYLNHLLVCHGSSKGIYTAKNKSAIFWNVSEGWINSVYTWGKWLWTSFVPTLHNKLNSCYRALSRVLSFRPFLSQRERDPRFFSPIFGGYKQFLARVLKSVSDPIISFSRSDGFLVRLIVGPVVLTHVFGSVFRHSVFVLDAVSVCENLFFSHLRAFTRIWLGTAPDANLASPVILYKMERNARP